MQQTQDEVHKPQLFCIQNVSIFRQIHSTKQAMISFKTIQHFTPNHLRLLEKEPIKKRKLTISLCTSTNSENADEKTPPPKGDSQKQELLAKIAMLQTQKVRLTDYLDERSDYLTQFAEQANTEIDQIGENALRELDEAGERIMGNIESQMQAFEESVGMNKSEIEESEKKLADFEGQIEKDRNEWLFFKSLREKKPPVDGEKAKEEAEKIRELTKKSAGSVIRRNVYIVLIGLVVIGIVDGTISPIPDWKKIGVLGVILVGLVSQIIYEQSVLSETKKTDEKRDDSKE